MKVFISWSGERSKAAATALRAWIPLVLQGVTPWMSRKDIGAGARWGQELDEELDSCNFGILCLTPENPESPWLLYEAGALGKAVSVSHVVPYLIGMEPDQIPSGPLARFQAKRANKDETRELVAAMNSELGERSLPVENVGVVFEKWWPDLEQKLREIPPASAGRTSARPSDDMLAEVLNTVRDISRHVVERGAAPWEVEDAWPTPHGAAVWIRQGVARSASDFFRQFFQLAVSSRGIVVESVIVSPGDVGASVSLRRPDGKSGSVERFVIPESFPALTKRDRIMARAWIEAKADALLKEDRTSGQ